MSILQWPVFRVLMPTSSLSLVVDLASESKQRGHAPQTRVCQNLTITGTATYVTVFRSVISCLSLLWPEAQSLCFLSNGLVQQNLLTGVSVEIGCGRWLSLALYPFTPVRCPIWSFGCSFNYSIARLSALRFLSCRISYVHKLARHRSSDMGVGEPEP
jgi:hypothetical protein